MNRLSLLLFSLFLLASCGGGSSSDTQPFQLLIGGKWRGDIRQSNLRCISSDGSIMHINACSGCTLGEAIFTISGGLNQSDSFDIVRGDGCTLSGTRTKNNEIEAFPTGDICSPYLIQTNFIFQSSNSASYTQVTMNPPVEDVSDAPLCILDAIGDIMRSGEADTDENQ